MNEKSRLVRSVLYSPASRIDRVEKALAAGAADVVVADLEDGTAGPDKPKARESLARMLRSRPPARARLAVRVNPWPSPAAHSDLDAITSRTPDVVVLPKVESPGMVADFIKNLKAVDVEAPVFAQIENARGLFAAPGIASVAGVAALIFGAEDYAADVGATRTPAGLEVLYARSHVVAAAASAGIDAVDQIWADYKDLDGLRADATFGAGLGYAGKQLIHPEQIPVVHNVYHPTAHATDRARRIVEASDRAQGGVVVVDGRMIDRPLVEQARRVLQWAQAE